MDCQTVAALRPIASWYRGASRRANAAFNTVKHVGQRRRLVRLAGLSGTRRDLPLGMRHRTKIRFSQTILELAVLLRANRRDVLESLVP